MNVFKKYSVYCSILLSFVSSVGYTDLRASENEFSIEECKAYADNDAFLRCLYTHELRAKREAAQRKRRDLKDPVRNTVLYSTNAGQEVDHYLEKLASRCIEAPSIDPHQSLPYQLAMLREARSRCIVFEEAWEYFKQIKEDQ